MRGKRTGKWGGGGAGRRAKGKQEAGRGRHNLPTPVPKNVPARRVIKFTLAAEKKSLGVRLCEENQYSRASLPKGGLCGRPKGWIFGRRRSRWKEVEFVLGIDRDKKKT